jgi:PAS domain S-box-containing protein
MVPQWSLTADFHDLMEALPLPLLVLTPGGHPLAATPAWRRRLEVDRMYGEHEAGISVDLPFEVPLHGEARERFAAQWRRAAQRPGSGFRFPLQEGADAAVARDSLVVCFLPAPVAGAILWVCAAEAAPQAESLPQSREEAILEALACVSDAAWVGVAGSGRLKVSPGWFSLLGYPPEAFGVNPETWIAMIHPEDQDRCAGALHAHLTEGQAVDMEYRLRCRDGEYRWVRCRGSATDRGASGGTRCVVGRHGDITWRKRAESVLKESEAQLHQAQKMEALGTLVAGMAHEIHNPVSLILFNLPIIRRIWADVLPMTLQQAAEEPGRKFGGYAASFLARNLDQLLADMDLAAGRVSKIVRDLKDFARQTPVSEKESIQVNDAVTQAVRLAQSTVRSAGAQLEMRLADKLPPIEGHRQSVEQVILNLVINALEAIGHHEGRIVIRTGAQDSGQRVWVSVSDNGRGIAEAIQGRIFDPFVTDKQSQGGTGLGLSVSYSLVKAHHGHISFETQAGQGSTFTVELPRVQPARIRRILVVDDDAMIRQMLRQALQRVPGYRVDEAADGIDGLIKLGTATPDLLVLDLKMPGMNGLEVCRAIRKNAKLAGLRVIVTTGHPGHPDLDAMAALGFDQTYTKPIRLAAFTDAVQRILEGAEGA